MRHHTRYSFTYFRTAVASLLVFLMSFSPVFPALSQLDLLVEDIKNIPFPSVFNTGQGGLTHSQQREKLAFQTPLFHGIQSYINGARTNIFNDIFPDPIGAPSTLAASYTWDGGAGSDDNWSTCANWSSDICPTSADIAVFDGTSSDDVLIDTSINVAGIDINTGYGGTITQGSGNTITVGSSNFDMATGTFVGGNSTIDINGTFTLSGGTFTSTSGTWEQKLALTISGGTFNHNSGTITLDCAANACTNSVDVGSAIFNNVQANLTNGGNAINVTGNLDVNGDLTISLVGNINTGNITVAGNVTSTDTSVGGTATIILDGTGAQTLSAGGGSGALPSVTVDKASGTLTLQDSLTISKAWTYTQGTVDPGTSTIAFNCASNVCSNTVSAEGMSFNNVQANLTNGGNAINVTGNLDVNGDLTISLVSNINTGNITVAGNITSTDTSVGGTATITLDGTGAQTITTTAGDLPDGTFTINKASGTATLGSAINFNGTGQDITFTDGTLNLAGYNLTVNDTLTVSDGAILQLHGNETITATTKTLSTGSHVIYTGDNDGTSDDYTVSHFPSPDKLSFMDSIPDLVGYWKFDEGTGTTAADSSGNGNDGTFVNSPTWTSTSADVSFTNPYAVDFSGDRITLSESTPSAFDFPGGFSGSAWIKTATSGRLIAMFQNSSPLIYMQVGPTSVGGTADKFVVYLRTSGGSLKTVSGATTVTDNEWHHVAFVRDTEEQEVRLYVDGGDPDATSSYTDTNAINTSGGTHQFGGSGNNYLFDGTIDDVRIYNRALTAEEIAALASGSSNFATADADTFTFGTNLDVGSNLNISGSSVNQSTYTLNLAGSWYNNGTFEAASSTVTLDGTSQSLDGDTTFYNLSKTEGSDDTTDETLTFTAGDTYTIENTLTLDGRDTNDRINLVSSTPGTAWSIDPQGTRTLDNIEVTDSTNTNSTVINEYSDSTVVDGGSNTGWLFSTSSAFTWIGGTNSNWSTASNWLGGVAPTSSDVAVFDGSSDVNVTIDTNINVSGIDINTGYDGTITQATGSTITIGSGNYNQAAGTFVGGNATIDINGTFTLSGGTFTATSGTWEQSDELTISGGTFSHNSGTLKLAFTDFSNVISVGSATFNDLVIADGGSGREFSITGTLDIDGDVAVTNWKEFTSGTMTVGGDSLITDSSISGAGVIEFDGTGDQTISASGGSSGFPAIEVNKASGILYLEDRIVINGTGATSWTQTAGTVDAGVSEVVIATQNANLDAAGVSFYDLTFNTASSGRTITLLSNLDVNGTLTLTNLVALDSSSIAAAGDFVVTDGSVGGTTAITLDGTGAQAITAGDLPDGTLTINKASGTATLASNLSVNASGQDLTITSGTLDLAGYNLTVNDTLTVTDSLTLQGAETVTASTKTLSSGSQVTYTGDGDSATDQYELTTLSSTYHHLTINSTDGTTDIFDTDSTITTTGTLTLTDGTLILQGDGNTLNASSISSSAGTVIYEGTTSATGFELGNTYNNLHINDGLVGYWKFDDGSGTTATDSSGYGNHGTLTNMDAGTDWVTGTTDINFTNPYALDFDGTDDYVSTSTFGSFGSTFDTGGITISSWVKTSGTTVQNIAGTTNDGTSTLLLLQLNSYYNGSTTVSEDNSIYFFVRSGSNINNFDAYLSASTLSSNGITLTDGNWHHVAVNATPSSDAAAWVIDGIPISSSYGRQSSPSTSNFEYPLFIGAANNRGTAGSLFTGQLDDVRIYNRALTATEISSLAAGTHPSSASATYTLNSNLDVNGNLTISSGALNTSGTNYNIALAGSLANDGGTLTTNASTLTLDGTATGKTIQTGGSDIYNLTMSGTGGAWTLTDDLFVTNRYSQTAGTLNTSTNNYSVTTADFDQTAGTFTANSSTLTLNSASNQTVNFTDSQYNLNIEDPTEQGLVGYWKFDEGQGTTAYDSSGNANNGTLTNNPTWTATTPSGISFENPYSLEFDGVDDYVDVGSGSSIDDISTKALTAWVNLDGYGGGNLGRIAAKGSWYLATQQQDSRLQFQQNFSGSAGNWKTPTNSLSTASWIHIAVVYDNSSVSNDPIIYVDGTVQSPLSEDVTPSGSASSDASEEMFIGNASEGTRGLDGKLDDVRIYNRALSSAEISNLANGKYADGDNSTYVSTYTLNTNLDVNNNLALYSGILSAGSNAITVGNNWNNTSGNDSFTAGTSTVTLDNTTGSQQILGSTTFYNLTKTVTQAATLTFEAAKTIIVSNLTKLKGAASNLLSLVSSSPATQYILRISGTHDLQYLNIQDANNDSGDTAYVAEGTNSGNNTGFEFNAVIWGGGGGDNNWSTTANWVGGSLPTSSDTAVFNSTSSKDVTIDTNINVAGIDIQSDYSGTITQATGSTITVGSGNYSQAAGTFTGGNSTIDINGTYTLSGGTFTSTSGTMTLGQPGTSGSNTFTVSGGTFDHNSGSITIDAQADFVVNIGSTTLNNVTYAGNTGRTITVTGTMDVDGNFTLTSVGSFKGGTIAVAGNVTTTTAGVTTSSTATIKFDGAGDQTLSASGGSGRVAKISIDKSSGTLTIADTIVVAGDNGTSWTHTNGVVDAGSSTVQFISKDTTVSAASMAFNNVVLNMGSGRVLTVSGAMDIDGNLTITRADWMNGGGIELAGDLLSTDTGVSTSTTGTTITLDGAGSQTITATSADLPDGTFTINKASGTATLGSAINLNGTSQDLTITSGTLNLAGYNLTVNDTLTVTDSLTLQGAETITATTKTLSSGSTVTYTGDGDSLADTYTITDHFTDFHHVTINSTDTTTDTYQLASNITIAGNLTNTGTFEPATYTTTLDGTSQSLDGDTTFYNLTKTEGSDDTTDETLTFTAGDTYTIENTLTLDGRDANDRINLVSSTPGTQYTLDPQGTRTLDNIEVIDSNNTNATPIDEESDSTVVDGGNNTGWIFSTTSAYTWKGATNANWSEGTNWVGGTAPTSGNVAIFDGSSDKDATIDTNINVSGIDINTGYDGTITQATGSTITVGSGNYNQAAGTFTGGNATIDVNGTYTLSGGTFTSTSGNLDITTGGASAISGGTFNHNSGTVRFIDILGSLTPGAATFNDVTIDRNNQAFTITGTLDIDGDLVLGSWDSNPMTINGGTVEVAGNVTTHNNATQGTATIEFNGTADQTLSASGGEGGMPRVEINKLGGTLIIQDTIRLDGATTGNSSRWIHTQGVVDAGTSTVKFSEVGGTVDASGMSFYNLILNRENQDFTITGSLDINNDFTFGGANNLNGNGPVTVGGDLSWSDTSLSSTTAITLDGTGSQTITATSADLPDGILTINKSSGTATLASNLSVNASGQDLTITSGTLDLAGYNLTVNDTLTVTDSLTLQGAETITASTKTLSSGSTITYTGDGDSAADTYTITDQFTDYHNLTLNSTDAATDTFALGANTTVAGNFTNTTGTFNPSTYTTTFDGTSSGNTITNADSFYDLTVNGSGGVWDMLTDLTVTNDLTITNGTLDLNGFNLDLTGTFTNNGTFRLKGTETLTNFTNDTDSGTVDYDGTTTITGLITGLIYNHLTFSGAGTYDPDGNLSIAGNLINSAATLANLASRTLTLSGITQTLTLGTASALGSLLVTGSSGTVTLGSSLTLNTLLSIAAGRTLNLSSYSLTSNGDITNLGTINESSGEVIHDSTSFYIADNSFDQNPAISLGVEDLYISVTDQDANLDGTTPDTISNAVTVTCTNDSETLSLTETGNATEVFRYTTGLSVTLYDGSATNNDSVLECTDGETITATYADPQDNTDTQTDTATATSDTIPTAPSTLTGSADSATAITWSWTDNANNETGFKIYNAANDALITTIATANTTSYQETGLTAATSYQRYVVAYNTAGNSTASSTATTATDAATPTAPSSFTGVETTNTSITWSWTDNSSNESGFKLLDSNGTLIATIDSANTTSYTETGLTSGNAYTRKLVAYNGSGDSSATDTASVTLSTSVQPNAFSLVSPATGTLTQDITPTFTWQKATDDDDDINTYTLYLTQNGTTTTYTGIPKDADNASNPVSKTHYTTTYTAQYFNENDGNDSNDTIALTPKTALSDAAYTWYVRVTDEESNTRDSATRTLTIDGTAPYFSAVRIKDGDTLSSDLYTTSLQTLLFHITTKDTKALSQLTVTLEQSRDLFNLFTLSYTPIKSSTYTLSGTRQTTTHNPQITFEQGRTYRLTLTVTDTAGNTTTKTHTIRIATEAQQAAEEISQLDPDTTSVDDIITKIRETLPESLLSVPDLERSALLRREKQAQAFNDLFRTPVEKAVAYLLQQSGTVQRYAMLALNGLNVATDTTITWIQQVAIIITDTTTAIARAMTTTTQTIATDTVRTLASIRTTVTDTLVGIAVATHTGTLKLAAALNDNIESVDLYTPTKTAANALGDTALGIQAIIADIRLPDISTPRIAITVPQFGLKDRILALLQAGQETRVRTGLANRQAIAEEVHNILNPMQRFGRKVALYARHGYELFFDNEPTQITNVRITQLAPTSAVIEWETNHLTSSGKVNYGTSTQYGNEKVLPYGYATQHRAEITGLDPTTTYYFEVMNQNGSYVFDAYYTLTTPAEEVIQEDLVPQEATGKDGELIVYQSPNPGAQEIGRIPHGRWHRALLTQDGWISVLLDSGAQGWVREDEVELRSQTGESTTDQNRTF